MSVAVSDMTQSISKTEDEKVPINYKIHNLKRHATHVFGKPQKS